MTQDTVHDTQIQNFTEATVDPGWSGYRFADADPDGWVRFWRMDPRGEDLRLDLWLGGRVFPISPLWQRTAIPAGVHGRWRVPAGRFDLEIAGEPGLDGHGQLDVLVGDRLALRHQVESGSQWIGVDVPEESVVEVWLPLTGEFRCRGLRMPDGTRAEPRTGLRWTAYGSSITQGATADGASETWTALIARRAGWQLTPLGFGGECHLDPPSLRTVRAVGADVITLCLGINIWASSTFNGRTLAPAVAEFVRQAREAHPQARIVVITPLPAPEWESRTNEVGLQLEQVRSLVAGAARSAGVEVIDGPDLFTHEEAGRLLADDVHPDGTGHRLIADRLSDRLARR